MGSSKSKRETRRKSTIATARAWRSPPDSNPARTDSRPWSMGKHVKLTPEAKRRLKSDAEKWEFLEFFEHAGENHPFGQAHIQKHMATGRKPTKEEVPSTVVFLVRTNMLAGVDNTPGVPCGFLACFGMDGYSTLNWSRIVRLRHPDWLVKPGFIMAELLFKKPIPRRPLTPEFATDPTYVQVNMLTDPPAPGPA